MLAVAAGDLTLRPLMGLRLATVLMLLAGAAAVWAARHTPWRRPVPLALLALAGGTAVWTPVALLRAPDAGSGRAEVQGLLAGLAVALAALALSRARQRGLDAMRLGWMLALALSVVVATFELITDAHLWIDPELAWAKNHRTIVSGAFRNPNDFAIALAAMISGTLSVFTTSRRSSVSPSSTRAVASRRVALVLVALGSVGVVLTQSRSGLLALLAVLAIHAVFGLRRPGRHLNRRVMWVAGGVGAVVVAASVLVPALAARNPIVQAIRATGEPGTARSDALRVDLVRAALRYFEASDGLGTGAASFEVLLARDPAPGVATRTWLHNSFMEVLLQYGVVVTSLLAVVLLAVLVAALRPRRRPGREVAGARAEVFSSLAVFVLLGTASATVVTTPIWWLVLGQACASAWWLQTADPAPGSDAAEDHPDHLATTTETTATTATASADATVARSPAHARR